jgi:hypothetical protein
VKTPRKRCQKCWRVVLQKKPAVTSDEKLFGHPNKAIIHCSCVQLKLQCIVENVIEWATHLLQWCVQMNAVPTKGQERWWIGYWRRLNFWWQKDNSDHWACQWQKCEWPGNGKNQKREFRIHNFISKLGIRNWFFPSIWWAGQSVMKLGISRWFLQSACAMTISNALTK